MVTKWGEQLLFMTKFFPQDLGQGLWSLKRFQRPHQFLNSADKDLREYFPRVIKPSLNRVVLPGGRGQSGRAVFDVFIDGHFYEIGPDSIVTSLSR